MPEFATATGGGGPFPADWGRPPGAADSEERAAWVRQNVRHYLAGAPLRELRSKQARLLHVLRTAELERKRQAP